MTTRKRIGQVIHPPEVTVEQIIIGGSDVINFPASQAVGIQQGTTYSAIIGQADAGFATTQGATTLHTIQSPGVGLVETFISMVSAPYVNAASESAGSDWEGVPNSQGTPDGSYATLTEGLALTQGTLIGDYVNPVNKDALTITKVEVEFFYSFANFLLPGTTLQLQYRNSLTLVTTTLRTIAGNGLTASGESHLVTPQTFDITALGPTGTGDAWTWASISNFQSLYNGTMLVDVGLAAIQVDTTRLRVTSNLTEVA